MYWVFLVYVRTCCLFLIDPLPSTAIFVIVSSWSRFIEFPFGPRSFPTKLNCKDWKSGRKRVSGSHLAKSLLMSGTNFFLPGRATEQIPPWGDTARLWAGGGIIKLMMCRLRLGNYGHCTTCPLRPSVPPHEDDRVYRCLVRPVCPEAAIPFSLLSRQQIAAFCHVAMCFLLSLSLGLIFHPLVDLLTSFFTMAPRRRRRIAAAAAASFQFPGVSISAGNGGG